MSISHFIIGVTLCLSSGNIYITVINSQSAQWSAFFLFPVRQREAIVGFCSVCECRKNKLRDLLFQSPVCRGPLAFSLEDYSLGKEPYCENTGSHELPVKLQAKLIQIAHFALWQTRLYYRNTFMNPNQEFLNLADTDEVIICPFMLLCIVLTDVILSFAATSRELSLVLDVSSAFPSS